MEIHETLCLWQFIYTSQVIVVRSTFSPTRRQHLKDSAEVLIDVGWRGTDTDTTGGVVDHVIVGVCPGTALTNRMVTRKREAKRVICIDKMGSAFDKRCNPNTIEFGIDHINDGIFEFITVLIITWELNRRGLGTAADQTVSAKDITKVEVVQGHISRLSQIINWPAAHCPVKVTVGLNERINTLVKAFQLGAAIGQVQCELVVGASRRLIGNSPLAETYGDISNTNGAFFAGSVKLLSMISR